MEVGSLKMPPNIQFSLMFINYTNFYSCNQLNHSLNLYQHKMPINFTIKINDSSSNQQSHKYFYPKDSLFISMEQQLRRIKNKDLSTLDERLFGNLDKVETINSTIENLGQFQQFLLKQISQFEEKAKTKNKNKQVTEVIELNCMTLRESIMNVVPDDLEKSRSRLIEPMMSPINGFRSTRTGAFSKVVPIQQTKQHECKQKELMKKIQQMQITQKKCVRKFQELKTQISAIKLQNSKLKVRFNEMASQLKKQFEIKLRKQVDSLYRQSSKIKQECQKLKELNIQLSKQFNLLQNQAELTQQKHIQKLFQNPLLLSAQTQIYQSSQLKKSQLKESDFPQKRKSIQSHLQTQNKPTQYKSFKDKMKFDFTSKLNKFEQSDIKPTRKLEESQNAEQGSDTFRESNTIELEGFQSVFDQSKGAFRSIQISRKYDTQLDPNVPKLLKRNSIVGQYHSSNISQQHLSYKNRSVLQTFDSNIGIRSSYQSMQRPRQTTTHQSTSKKSNHDLMRKTKSNFFKMPIQNKQNAQIMQSVYDTNIAKMKGLVSQSNPNQRKRNSQSKQKLKIFSMI